MNKNKLNEIIQIVLFFGVAFSLVLLIKTI
jgi:hypothetical protein